MNRRQPMAPLSPSQQNNGKGGGSAAPGRLLKDVAGIAGKGRKSVAPGALSSLSSGPERRSSILPAGPKSSGPKQDPRPLNSKEYQSNCIKTIINYLTTHGCPLAVSPKTLASPTGKDFSAIVTFLFQKVDSAFRIQGKVEDEVPQFFKRLNYPFQISKSALFAVGTPHSWPAVLAALTWLVELLEYWDKVQASSNKCSGFENKVELFLDYLADSYYSFLSGDDERCDKLDNEMAGKVIQQQAELDASCEELVKANEQIVTEIAALKAQRDPLELAMEEQKENIMVQEKFESLVSQDQGLKQTSLRKLAERKADVHAKQDQINAAVEEVEQLRERVAGQTVNKADLQRLILERNTQKEVLDAERTRCVEAEQRNSDQEKQIIKWLSGIESLAARYLQLANRLKLIPATSKRAGGMNYELRLNRSGASQAEFSNLDLKGTVKPNLERLCDTYRKRASELSQDLLSLQETCLARKESVAEKEEERYALQAEITKLEAQLQSAKEVQEEKCRNLVAKAEGIKAQVDEYHSAACNKTVYMQEQLARAQHVFEQTKRECEAELSQLEADLKQAIKMLISHKEFIAATLNRTAAAVAHVRGEVAELHLTQLPQIKA